jgi:hypothetical protein
MTRAFHIHTTCRNDSGRRITTTSESGCWKSNRLKSGVAGQTQRVAHQQRTDSSGFDAYSCRTIRPVHPFSSDALPCASFARCSLRATFFRDRHVSIFLHSYRKVAEVINPELSVCPHS